MSGAQWEGPDGDEPGPDPAIAGAPGTPDGSEHEPDAPTEASAPAGSVLALLQQEAEQIAEDDGWKILPVGKHEHLHARYRMLKDEELDELQAAARRRHNQQKRIRRRQKGDTDLTVSNGENPEAERYFDALVVAKSCTEILFKDPETGKLTPLHELSEFSAVTPITYNRTLAKIARLDHLFDLNLETCTPVEVAIAMHTATKERSTAPLTSYAQILKIWMGAIDVQAMQEALGGN